MVDWDNVNVVLALILVVSLSFLLGFGAQKDRYESLNLACKLDDYNYSETLGKGGRVVGLAGDHVFCVSTKQRTILEVLNTCTHEYAHTELGLMDP